MIRKLISLAVVVAFGLLGYNYFFGTDAEKEQSKQVFAKAKDLGADLVGVLKQEHTKMQEGKYDGALDKLADTYKKIRTGVSHVDSDVLDEIAKLEHRRNDLQIEETKLEKLQETLTKEEYEQLASKLQSGIEELYKDTEQTLEEVKQ